MQIHRYFIEKSLDNFNHIIYCPITRQAVAVDPFNRNRMIEELEKLELNLTAVWLTHTHHDHIRAVNDIQNLDTVPVFARRFIDKIKVDQVFDLDKPLKLGQSQLKILDTPGHYPDHVCFFFNGNKDNTWLVSGDTLMNAGIGHVRDGNIDQLFDSVSFLIDTLPDECKLYSGHNYLINNCKFTLSIQPDNQNAAELVETYKDSKPDNQPITDFKTEKVINLFMQTMVKSPKQHNLTNIQGKTAKEKFISLRLLRDQW